MPKTYKNWHEDDLLEAVTLVENGCSKTEAASANVAFRDLLCMDIWANLMKKNALEKNRNLSDHDEQQLVNYGKFVADAGEPMSSKVIWETAGRIARERYIYNQ